MLLNKTLEAALDQERLSRFLAAQTRQRVLLDAQQASRTVLTQLSSYFLG